MERGRSWRVVVGFVAALGFACTEQGASDGNAAGSGAAGSAGVLPGAGGSAGAVVSGTGGAAPIAGTGSSAGGGSGSAGIAGSAGAGGAAGSAGASGALSDAGLDDGNAPDSAVDDVPVTGTFPAVVDVGAEGPFTAVTVTSTGPNGVYTLYHPQDLAPGGVPNPIVSWGNGGGTTPSLYPMLPHLASHGFVVIASNSSSASGPLLKDGIDWVIAQNDDASSPLYQRLDTDNVSGVGYSLGGLATYAIADDPRFVTIVIISGANMQDKSPVAKLHTPTAYFCTDDSASEGNCDGDFEVVTVPAFYGVMKGTGHVDVVTVAATRSLVAQVTTGWLRWHQMADQTQKPTFVGAACTLCQDSDWVVQQKNDLM